MYPKIIALDYDGTIALNSWPQAGDPNWPIINKAKAEKAAGSRLILWTCREGEELDIALAACAEWGLEFDAVNDNLPEMKEAWGNNPRKIFANEYWDDRAVNPILAEKLWKDVVHCISMARKAPHMSNFFWGVAGGKASALDAEKFRLVEELSVNCNDTAAVDKFLAEYGGVLNDQAVCAG